MAAAVGADRARALFVLVSLAGIWPRLGDLGTRSPSRRLRGRRAGPSCGWSGPPSRAGTKPCAGSSGARRSRIARPPPTRTRSPAPVQSGHGRTVAGAPRTPRGHLAKLRVGHRRRAPIASIRSRSRLLLIGVGVLTVLVGDNIADRLVRPSASALRYRRQHMRVRRLGDAAAYTGRAPIMLADGSRSRGAPPMRRAAIRCTRCPIAAPSSSAPAAGRRAADAGGYDDGKAPAKIEAKPPQQTSVRPHLPGQSESPRSA